MPALNTHIIAASRCDRWLQVLRNHREQEERGHKRQYNRVRSEILSRVDSICKSGLNGRNTIAKIAAINECTLSVMNYYTDAIPLESADYLKIHEELKNKVHLQPANTERLYLPRSLKEVWEIWFKRAREYNYNYLAHCVSLETPPSEELLF